MSSLVLIPQYFGSLLYDRASSRYYPFDHRCTQILRCLRRSPMYDLWESTRPDRLDELMSFCRQLETNGMIDVNGRLPAELLEPPICDNVLSGPLAVHLEVIAACDLACSHCFAGDLPRNNDPLRLDEIETLFDELAGMGCFRIGITGGEPLLRADLVDILDAATERGLNPCVTTNGTQLTPDLAAQFAGRPSVWLNVSLDGASAETNDAIRGAGAFEKVTDNLRLLAGSLRYTLAFTLTSKSVEEVELCAELARDLQAANAVFRPLYPTGIAARNMELMPTFQQYTEALNRLIALGAAKEQASPIQRGADESIIAKVRTIDPLGPDFDHEGAARLSGVDSCGAGKLSASISVQGDVNPCSFLGSEFNVANIRDTPFSEIWRNSGGLKAIRQAEGAACDGCGGPENNQGDGFAGGCRARALQMNGDASRSDPWHDKHMSECGVSRHPLVNLEVTRERS